jgi:hypothetical protein
MNEKESEKMKIKLKDGSFKEYDKPMRIIDIAADLSEGLARMACVGEVNGKVQDLRTVLNEDCELNKHVRYPYDCQHPQGCEIKHNRCNREK